ncbi:CPBP family intramembrane glutamic endopeptidase [Convivina praedatoris]|uniref:CAAX prenyl protease 2/Lysostaphin resistance protein A-like domain-containing protein n=1 Tax=Convivina praedatoris TaxID=2880963 RepID=A0ABN8HAE6_9LACO|nr:type II CAAX endopeptidase family protein [Convivina sp. LMG 32447]CAH1855957.1 hypothetical protein R077815_01326 [Convivina sp. LMG 32447]CAH1856512.1 hypothetical protein LMG032447_01304 [Convivina sp. LMG 32447]CAH1857299.1 hypothetical protein R078138_01554 [Convivina sp. LMG 32447]
MNFFKPDAVKIGFKTYLGRAGILFLLLVAMEFADIPLGILSEFKVNLVQTILLGIAYIAAWTIVILLGYYYYQKLYKKPLHNLAKNDYILIVTCYLVAMALEHGLSYLNQWLYHQTETQNDQAIQAIMDSNSASLVLMVISVIIFAPICEELLFRGLLIKGLLPNVNPNYAIVISGLVFSAMHQSSNVISFAIYAVMGMSFAYAYVKTDRIEVSIALHMLNNTVATVLNFI